MSEAEKQILIGRVELAIEANGGGDYNPEECKCTRGLGSLVACRYCAIRDALNETLRYLRAQAKL